jgi:hypothetical protein
VAAAAASPAVCKPSREFTQRTAAAAPSIERHSSPGAPGSETSSVATRGSAPAGVPGGTSSASVPGRSTNDNATCRTRGKVISSGAAMEGRILYPIG